MTWVFQMGTSASYGKESVQVSVSKTRSNRITDTYVCGAVQAFDLSLSAGQNIGMASVTLGNMDGAMFQDLTAKPHAMDILHVRGRNRHGIWGPMWTGYLDSVHQVDTAGQGRTAVLNATSPQKQFQKTLQLPGDVVALATSSIVGLSGSAILRYICNKTPTNYPGALRDLAVALGYESSLAPDLIIDPNANSGMANWGGIAAAVFLDPNQQSWESVLEGLVGDSGIHWFFDEMGSLIWQQPKYITGARDKKPVILTEEDLFMRDLAESDEGVLTSVTVRYGIVELNNISQTVNTQDVANLAATKSLGAALSGGSNPIKDQLGTRVMVIYANWIMYPDSARNLAALLLEMYASNVLIGTVIIPPDPTITIGSLVQVPTGRRINAQGDEEQGTYYVAAIEYTLAWGSSYVMVLGLQYGRGVDTGWAYPGAQPYPQLTIPANEKLNTTIASYDNGNAAKITNAFTIVDRPGLLSNEAVVDPAIISPGTTFILTEYLPPGVDGPAHPIGPSNTGIYTAVAGTKNQGFVIYIADPGSATKGTVTLSGGAAAAPVFGGDAGGGPNSGPALLTPPVTIPPGGLSFTRAPLTTPFSFTQPFGVRGGDSGEPSYFWPADSNNFVPHFHAGIDVSNTTVSGVEQVFSVCPGVVVACIPNGSICNSSTGGYHCNAESGACAQGCNFQGLGNTVVVKIGNYLVHYSHLDSFLITVGSGVKAGTPVGYEGTTAAAGGFSTGPHVHLGVWDLTTEAWVDPVPFFDKGGISIQGSS